MSETNKSYRIRTEIGSGVENINIPVSLVQDFDTFEILSLSIKSVDEYKKDSANYGVVVGRVLANNGFGIPNAKISIFISADDTDGNFMRYLYPYTSSFAENSEGVRYNLLPDEYVSDCHQIVGTFPNKRFMLDNDVLLEVFDKYYKFTTRTNKSGDYLICGVPVGQQTIHMDLDISDCGILSQRPRDFVYKGYNIEQFENPNKFKDGTNYRELSQIFTQDKTINVEPFWGNASDGQTVGITRADIDVAFKFEPTCVFMGSAVSDNASNGITQKCIATPHMGDMDELTTGEGTIEMIRKTLNGGVEEFQVKGTQLINANGVWCYQIPMNLDYMTTDEYGNMVPTDNPEKGIPTRARVRFRLSLSDSENAKESFYRPKVLVPNNPEMDENGNIDYDYFFGTDTKDESYRDLFWNNVYSIKSFIPRFQKSRVFRSAWKDEKFTGIKHCNIFGPNNPIPYNNIRFRIPFLFLVLCALIKAFINVVGYVNAFITVTYVSLCKIAETIKDLATAVSLNQNNKGWNLFDVGLAIVTGGASLLLKATGKGMDDSADKLKSFADGAFRYITIDEGLCPDIEGWYFAPRATNARLLALTVNDLAETIEYGKSNLVDDTTSVSYENKEEKRVCITNVIKYLTTCVEMNLAQEYKVINFDFYNDWVNGMVYIPRFKKYIRPKSTFLGFIKIKQATKGCMDNPKIFDNSRVYTQMCSLPYDLSNNNIKINFDSFRNTNKYYEQFSQKQATIFNNGGLVHEATTLLGQKVYYLKPSERYTRPAIKGLKPQKINLFSTDLILLGSLNDCDIYGIPQAFKNLTSSSYLLPPNLPITNLEETGPLYNFGSDKDVCKTLKVKKVGNTSTTVKETEKVGYSFYVSDGDDIDSSAAEESEEVIEGGYSLGVRDLNKERGMSSAFSAETREIYFEDNEHTDTIALTEVSGIAWNWNGPGQGENNKTSMYYPGGHFLGAACWNMETNLKTCVNLGRICEIGSIMSERKEDAKSIDDYGKVTYTYNVPTGLISNDAIVDTDFRSMFSTMNMKKLIAKKKDGNGYLKYDFLYLRQSGFDGAMSSVVYGQSPYNDINLARSEKVKDASENMDRISKSKARRGTSYDLDEPANTRTKTIEDKSNDYLRFRLGITDLSKASDKFVNDVLPMYENSFYFYFGLKDGATALDEFNKQFFSNCESKLITDNEPSLKIEITNYDYDNKFATVNVTTKNLVPYDDFIYTFKPNEGTEITKSGSSKDISFSAATQANSGFGVFTGKILFNEGTAIESSVDVGKDFINAEVKGRSFNCEVQDELDRTADDNLGGCIEVKNLSAAFATTEQLDAMVIKATSPGFNIKCPSCSSTAVTKTDDGYVCDSCGNEFTVTPVIVSATKNGDKYIMLLPYYGYWDVNLYYNNEIIYTWKNIYIGHQHCDLFIKNINGNVVKIPDTFANYVLINGEQYDWVDLAASNWYQYESYFRNASIDIRRNNEKLYSHNTPLVSTIDVDENTIKYVYGFPQKIVNNNPVFDGNSITSLNLSQFNDTNNYIGGTAPENEPYNYYFITAQDVNSLAYWHRPVNGVTIENGKVKIENNNNAWKSYLKIGKPCVFTDIDTDKSVQGIFRGSESNAPDGIKNGIIRPMLYYPILNKPYDISLNILEWFGFTGNDGIDKMGRPEWADHMDSTGYFSHFSTLGYCVSGSVITPTQTCEITDKCERNGDEKGSHTYTTVPYDNDLVWSATNDLRPTRIIGTRPTTVKESKYDAEYNVTAKFKNGGLVVKSITMPSMKNKGAYNVYWGYGLDTNNNITYDLYLYFGKNSDVSIDKSIKYYFFPMVENNSLNNLFSENKFQNYYTEDYEYGWQNKRLYTCYLGPENPYVRISIEPDRNADTAVTNAHPLTWNKIKDKKVLFGAMQTRWYNLPLLLSGEDDKLYQVLITYGYDEWEAPNVPFDVNYDTNLNTNDSNPTVNGGLLEYTVTYYGQHWLIQIEPDNQYHPMIGGGTCPYKFDGYYKKVLSKADIVPTCEPLTQEDFEYIRVSHQGDYIINYTVYKQGQQVNIDFDDFNSVSAAFENFDYIQISSFGKFYPAKKYVVNENRLSGNTGVTSAINFLKRYENALFRVAYTTSNNNLVNPLTNGAVQIKNVLGSSVDPRNYGVFSVKEITNDFGATVNKIYKVYPGLVNKAVMNEIETYRRDNNIDIDS